MASENSVFKIYNKAPPSARSVSPVVIDNPHSGTVLPEHFQYNCPRRALYHVSDLYMNRLLRGIDHGRTPVLEMLIHRACIDVNRFAEELDPAEIRDRWDAPYRKSRNTDKGFGLFLRDLHIKGGLCRVYNENARPHAAEIKNRIARYHRPYYEALDRLLTRARAAHGFYVHINMHSMVRPAADSTDIILGDLHGRACAPHIRRFTAAYFRKEGLSVSFNTPYSGGALVKTTHSPAQGHHSLQIEIARDLYMNTQTLSYEPQKAARIEVIMKDFAKELEEFCLTHQQQLRPHRNGPGPTIKS